MKKQFVLMALIMLAGIFNVNAQPPGGMPRRTVEERVKSVHEKLDSAFKPDVNKMALLDSIFTNYYKAQDKSREEMMASGSTDRDAMRAKMMELAADRDEKLKKVLSEAEMKIWKDDIEPAMRPQRRPQGQ